MNITISLSELTRSIHSFQRKIQPSRIPVAEPQLDTQIRALFHRIGELQQRIPNEIEEVNRKVQFHEEQMREFQGIAETPNLHLFSKINCLSNAEIHRKSARLLVQEVKELENKRVELSSLAEECNEALSDYTYKKELAFSKFY